MGLKVHLPKGAKAMKTTLGILCGILLGLAPPAPFATKAGEPTQKPKAKGPKLTRPQEPKKPYPYLAEEVSYENQKAKVKLAGTLTLPKGKGPFPAALLITGSGPQNRDEEVFGHRPFLVLADHLTRRGLAVLRVDDRGVGGSTGDTMQSTTADFAEDVLVGVEYLKGRKEIDPKRIGLIGHSEGGMIGPLAASRSKDVAFVVMLGGMGLTGEQILYVQGGLITKAVGADDRTLARQRRIQELIFRALKQEKDDAAAEKRFNQLWDEEMAKLPEGEKKDTAKLTKEVRRQFKLVNNPWTRYFLTHDPRPALREVTCPVLALFGEKDLQVPPRENLPEVARALAEGTCRDYTVAQLPGLNHLFQTCKTGSLLEYSSIQETMAPVALETISAWILNRMKKN
jgi:pimeloyl-ACP methyl ester carboxylesterase